MAAERFRLRPFDRNVLFVRASARVGGVPPAEPASKTTAKSRAGASLFSLAGAVRVSRGSDQTLEVRETVDGVVDGLASCDPLKVGELHLQGDSPPSDGGRLAMPPDRSGRAGSRRIPALSGSSSDDPQVAGFGSTTTGANALQSSRCAFGDSFTKLTNDGGARMRSWSRRSS